MSHARRRSGPWPLLAALAALAALMLVAVACGGDDEAEEGGGEAAGGETQQVELLLPYQRSIAFIGEIMAQENGYFADEGIELEPLPTEGGSFVTQQVIAGNRKFGMAGAQSVDVAVSQGSDLRAIWEHDRDIILMGTPADGDIQSVADLEGKALGITDPGGGEVALVNAVLAGAGLQDEVDTPAVGPGGPAVFEALESGRIAAYSGFTNDLAAVEAEGLTLRNILPEEFRGLPSNTLVMTASTFENEADRETMIKIARAWTRGSVAALNDPEGALRAACEYVPEECQDMNVARAFMNATLNGIKPREGLQMGEFDYASLEKEAELLAERDLGSEEIEFQEVFTNEFIDEINDFEEPQLEAGAPELLEVEG